MGKKTKKYVVTWTFTSSDQPDCNSNGVDGVYGSLKEAQANMRLLAQSDLAHITGADDEEECGSTYEEMAQYAEEHGVSFEVSDMEVKVYDREESNTIKITEK